MKNVGRRTFCAAAATAAMGLLAGCGTHPTTHNRDEFIKEFMTARNYPGLAIGIVKDQRLAWAQAYGLADIEQQRPMTLDTIINIASITKTITTTAFMQLQEEGLVDLDGDINAYLPFKVINSHAVGEKITPRQLLTHTSGILDSPIYYNSYSCGDPTISLDDWLRAYLLPGGEYYDRDKNYSQAKPGSAFAYCNVGFALLGLIIESISVQEYNRYCTAHIFAPLGMRATSCYLADVDQAKHAIPYTRVLFGKPRGQVVVSPDAQVRGWQRGDFAANCLYSFPTRPDGLVRTSVNQLARFLVAAMNDGQYEQQRILHPETMHVICSDQINRRLLPAGEERQGLGWYARRSQGTGLIWGHAGHDPGVATALMFRPSDKVGVVALANAAGELDELIDYIFREAAQF